MSKKAILEECLHTQMLSGMTNEYEQIVMQSPNGIVRVSSDYVISFYNPSLLDIFNISKGEINQRNYSNLSNIATVNHTNLQFIKICLQTHKSLEYEVEIPNENQEKKIFAVVARPFCMPYSNQMSVVKYFKDITLLKKLEYERSQREKDRISAEIFGGISHRFNNILGPIFTCAELIGMNPAQEVKVAKHAKKIEQLVERLEVLVKELESQDSNYDTEDYVGGVKILKI